MLFLGMGTAFAEDDDRSMPKLALSAEDITIQAGGSAVFSCTMDPQEYSPMNGKGKVSFAVRGLHFNGVESLEYQVGGDVDADGWLPYDGDNLEALLDVENSFGPAIPNNEDNTNPRVFNIANGARTVHYRLTLKEEVSEMPEIRFVAAETAFSGLWSFMNADEDPLATATVNFTLGSGPEPETLPTPSFANVGEVTQGEALEIEWPADLNLKKYLNWGFILYVENDDNTELEMPEGATVSDLFMLMMGNGGGVSPWAKTGEPAFKIAYYDGDEEDWPSAIALSQTGVVKVRARLAAGKSQEDDPLVYSDEFTATYTVKERPRPTAPTFLVNDVEVEGASVVVESGAMVGFTNGYSDDEYMIFYVIDGEDADFENINMENLWFQEKVKLYIAGDEMDGEFAVTMGQTVKAATGQVMQDGSLWWSDIVTVVFTIKGDGPDAPETPGLPETVAVPTFVLASGEVEKGTEVTWTWNGEYDYDVMGVVYVANGTDADLDIDAAGLMELIAAWGEEEDDMEREDGVAYLYYEEAGAYKIEKNVTLKARLVLGALKEDSEEDEPGLELALSPVVEAAYTVKGEGPAVETVEAPVFNPATGAVKKGTKVSIACATEGAVIYYTVNGNEPTAESTEYKDEIEITANVTVKAIAIKGEAKSEVVEAAYTIDFTANEDEELAGVTVFPNPSNGLFNLELPVAATIEVFASNGVLTQRVNAAAGVFTLTLDRSGIYFLRIAGEGRTVIKRVIVR